MQNDWFTGRANAKEHKSEHICKPKTTSLIGQPQVAIQRMIDPAYHKINLLFMLSQQDESQVPAPQPPGSQLPTHRSRLPTPSLPAPRPVAPGSPPQKHKIVQIPVVFGRFFCGLICGRLPPWATNHTTKKHPKIHKRGHKSCHKNTSHTTKNTNVTTNHTTKNTSQPLTSPAI